MTGNLAKRFESTQQKHQNTSPKPRIEFLYENETREAISCLELHLLSEKNQAVNVCTNRYYKAIGFVAKLINKKKPEFNPNQKHHQKDFY